MKNAKNRPQNAVFGPNSLAKLATPEAWGAKTAKKSEPNPTLLRALRVLCEKNFSGF